MDITSIVSKIQPQETHNSESSEKSSEQWREDKMAELNELRALLDVQTLETFSSPEALDRQLQTQARLGNLSASNVLLVEAQLPGAREVRTFEEWKEKVRSVRIHKDEKALRILVPASVEKDGERRTFFNIGKVFDVSQTTAEPLENRAKVTDTMVHALLHSANTAVSLSNNLPEFAMARFNTSTSIIEVRPDLTQNVIAAISRAVAAAYRHRQGKSSDSHLTTMTAAILAYRIDPSAQLVRENLAVCVDHLIPNDPKDLRAMLTEAAQDAKDLHRLYKTQHRALCEKKKTQEAER